MSKSSEKGQAVVYESNEALSKEQLKHPDTCIFHLSTTHLSDACHVKLACDKLCTTKSSSTSSTSSSQGQLHHLTEDVFEDAVDTTDRIEAVDSQHGES